jgi:hypothetical protein
MAAATETPQDTIATSVSPLALKMMPKYTGAIGERATATAERYRTPHRRNERQKKTRTLMSRPIRTAFRRTRVGSWSTRSTIGPVSRCGGTTSPLGIPKTATRTIHAVVTAYHCHGLKSTRNRRAVPRIILLLVRLRGVCRGNTYLEVAVVTGFPSS